MLIHIVPQIIATKPCTLLDVTISEFDLVLTSGTELAISRIYRNRQYLVASKLDTEFAAKGILISTPNAPVEFTALTRWAVAGTHTAIHRVRYVLPEGYDTEADVYSSDTPRMLVKPLTDPRIKELDQVRVDMKLQEWPQETLDAQGYITERSEVVVLQKIPRVDYLRDPRGNGLPMLRDMFDLVSSQAAS